MAPTGATLPPFDDVVAAHGTDVWRFAVSQVGAARADDLFQETMLAALSAYPTLRDPRSMRAWLLRIAARKAIDMFRASARDPVPVEQPDAGAAPAPDMPDDALWRRVRELPPKQRHAVALRFLLDLDYNEIAMTMDTTAAAARRNAFEALQTLRREFPHLRPHAGRGHGGRARPSGRMRR